MEKKTKFKRRMFAVAAIVGMGMTMTQIEGRYRETSDKRTNSSLIKVTSLLGLVYEKKMYNNYYAYNWNNGVAFIWTRKF